MNPDLRDLLNDEAAPGAPQLLPLPELGLLRVGGADAADFLQGQLSCDIAAIGDDDATWASMNSPKGRVLALFRIYRRGQAFELLTHASVAETALKRLRMFVLRSRVTIEAVDDLFTAGLVDPGEPPAPSLRLHARQDGVVSLTLPGTDAARLVFVGDSASVEAALRERLPAGARPISAAAWNAIDIATGLPEVEAETQDRFVAQMLDLDRLGALSWTKGCYTGQEVIARLHYRGGIKRRLFAARVHTDEVPPGTTIRHAESGAEVGAVVRSAADGDHRRILAVLALGRAGETLVLDGDGGPTLESVTAPFRTDGDTPD